jgi:hypothetical protein
VLYIWACSFAYLHFHRQRIGSKVASIQALMTTTIKFSILPYIVVHQTQGIVVDTDVSKKRRIVLK